jgi:hypothetical protein
MSICEVNNNLIYVGAGSVAKWPITKTAKHTKNKGQQT